MRLSREAWASGHGKLFVDSLVAQNRSTESSELRLAQSLGASGARASSSYASTYTYTGRRWDAGLSLYYFRARYYDPALGQFVGRDPVRYVDGGSLFKSGLWQDRADPSGTCAIGGCTLAYRYENVDGTGFPQGFVFRGNCPPRPWLQLPLARRFWRSLKILLKRLVCLDLHGTDLLVTVDPCPSGFECRPARGPQGQLVPVGPAVEAGPFPELTVEFYYHLGGIGGVDVIILPYRSEQQHRAP